MLCNVQVGWCTHACVGIRSRRSLFSGPRNSKGVTRDLEVLLTTVCFVRVIAAVIHAVALPHQADAHAVLALEAELVARAVELGVLGCTEGNQRVSMEEEGRCTRRGHLDFGEQSIRVQSRCLGDLAGFGALPMPPFPSVSSPPHAKCPEMRDITLTASSIVGVLI